MQSSINVRDFRSQRIKNIPPSAIRRFFDIAATMDDVISLGIGEPDFVTPEPFLTAGIESLKAGETHYTSNAGMLELRQALSKHINDMYAVEYEPKSEILITVGVSEALYLFSQAFIDPGDEVLIPQPCFVSYGPEIMLSDGKAVYINTRVEEDFQPTIADLEAAVTPKTKALLLGYPSNPTGAVLTEERAREIAEFAVRHNLLVVSDEIYDQLVYGIDHVCMAGLPGMFDRTITLGGFSKDYAMTGWRIGYAAAPDYLLEGMSTIHQYTIMSAPTTAQIAALSALQNGAPYVEKMRNEYNRRRMLMVDGMNELALDCFEPRGAFYAFPSVKNSGMDDMTFAETLLLEEKVAVVPGSAFGESGAGYVRCCYATAYNEIEEALRRLQKFMERHG